MNIDIDEIVRGVDMTSFVLHLVDVHPDIPPFSWVIDVNNEHIEAGRVVQAIAEYHASTHAEHLLHHILGSIPRRRTAPWQRAHIRVPRMAVAQEGPEPERPPLPRRAPGAINWADLNEARADFVRMAAAPPAAPEAGLYFVQAAPANDPFNYEAVYNADNFDEPEPG